MAVVLTVLLLPVLVGCMRAESAFIARARCRTTGVAASAAPAEPGGSRDFFEMYTSDELSSLLDVHKSLFPDAATNASEGEDLELEGDMGLLGGKGSLHDLVLGAIAEIDAANDSA
jgi:hypothetical protein